MIEARDIELLFAIWERNVKTVRALNRSLKQDQPPESGIARELVSHLKQCAIGLVKPESRAKESVDPEISAVMLPEAARPDRQECSDIR
jgi:hypothetical protein